MKKLLQYTLITILTILLTCLIVNDIWAKPPPVKIPTNYDKKQDKHIKKNKDNIGINLKEINKIDNTIYDNNKRIDELEETDVNIVGEVNFIREKNYTVGLYGKFDVKHNEVPEVGLKIT